MEGGLVMPPPSKSREPEADLRRKPLVVGFTHRRGRHSGMDVERNIQLLGTTQERGKPRVVEEGAPDGSTDQRALVAQLFDCTLQFIGRRRRNIHRLMRKSREPHRVLRYCTC